MRIPLMSLLLSPGLLLPALFLQHAQAAVITSDTIRLDEGNFLYAYDDDNKNDSGSAATTTSPCQTVVMLQVGSAMRVTDYTKLLKEIVFSDPSLVGVIIDSNPRSRFRKNDGAKFAKLANRLATDLSELIPPCTTQPTNGFLVGGHSSGGEGVIRYLSTSNNAVTTAFRVSGFVGLDPYSIDTDGTMVIPVPSLNWGFSKMSCLVSPTSAARAAYQITKSRRHRAFYQLQTNNWNAITGGPHCSFANYGCRGMCNGKIRYPWMHEAIAESIHRFVDVIADGSDFDKRQFELGRKGIKLIVDD